MWKRPWKKCPSAWRTAPSPWTAFRTAPNRKHGRNTRAGKRKSNFFGKTPLGTYCLCSLSTGRKKLGILREVTYRSHVKVCLFGRTSSGKSSVVNALLGEPVLPCGLGRTTACFVEVRATAEVSPCLLLPARNNELDLVEVEPRCWRKNNTHGCLYETWFASPVFSSMSTVVSSLSTRSYGPSTSVVLLWPRGLSPIFHEEGGLVLVVRKICCSRLY